MVKKSVNKFALAVITFVFALIVIGIIFFISLSNKNPSINEINNLTVYKISVEDNDLVNYGGDYSGYSLLSLNISGNKINNVNISNYLLLNTPKTDILFLEYPYIEANKYLEFKNNLVSELKSYGLDVKYVQIGDLNNIKDSIIIVPSGLMPKYIFNNLDMLMAKGNVILFIGRDTNLLLDLDGAQEENKETIGELGYDSNHKSFGTVYFPLNNTNAGYLLHISGTLNEHDINKLISNLTSIILLESWENNLGYSHFSTKHFVGKKMLFTSGSKFPGKAIRTIYEISLRDAQNKNKIIHKVITSKPLRRHNGNMYGPKNIFPNQNFDYNINFNASYNQPVKLILRLDVYKKGILEKQLSDIVDEINIKNVWNGRYSYTKPLTTGDYLFVLKDQYKDIYAKMYVHVYDVQVSLVRIENNGYVFRILLDGKPLTSVISTDSVSIAFDDGPVTNRYVSSDGTFVVYTHLPKGQHIMHIYIKGVKIDEDFNNDIQTMFDLYTRYGTISLVIIIIVIIIFKHKPKQKYLITVPKFNIENIRKFKMNSDELIKLFERVDKEFGWNKLPLTLREISYGIRKYASKDREIIIMDANLEEALNSLVDKSKLFRFGNYYAPQEWYKDKNDAEDVMLVRMIRDKLVENGIEFKERQKELIVNTLIISPYTNDKEIVKLSRMKGKKVMIVFKNIQDMDEYKKSLDSLDKDKLRVSILISNNKVILTTIDRLGDLL